MASAGPFGDPVRESGGIRMSDARCLFSQAELCFRLASGPASPRLADELEALGRTLAREAIKLEFAREGGAAPGRKGPLS
jgi:hypothetical protein